MKRITEYILIFFIFICVCSAASNQEFLYKRTIKALNATLDFILLNVKLFNVDGILGVNMARVHLTKSLKNYIDPNVKKIITLLIEKTETIYSIQTPNLKNFPWKYYVFINYVIPYEMWLLDIEFSHGKLNHNPEVDTGSYITDNMFEYNRYVVKSTFNESISDNCIVEVATASNDTNPHYCPVSQICYDYMVKMPESYDSHLSGYGVTHMIFYLQILRSRNCIVNMEEFNILLNKACSYIFWELRKNENFGYIPILFDLFLEQIALCGLEGFAEFLEKRYLEYVLREQDDHGGFGISYKSWIQVKNKRIKREANLMPYGTNNHSTGLGAAVLALFLRLLLRKPFNNKAFFEK